MTMKTCSRIWRKSSLRYWAWLPTFSSAPPSRRRRASRAASICDSTSVPMRTSDSRRLASSFSKVSRGKLSLPEPAGDVSLGAAVPRLVEQIRRGCELDQLAISVVGVHQHEGCEVRHAGRLLHVVRDDDYRVVARQLDHQVLDLQSRNRVKGGARLIHENHFRADGKASRDDQPLLLPAG